MNIRPRALLVLIVMALQSICCRAAEKLFEQFDDGKTRLEYVQDIPVVYFSGTPEQIGRQHARLLGEKWQPLRNFTFGFIGLKEEDIRWKMLQAASNGLILNAPKHHQQELQALCEADPTQGPVVRVANTLPELRRFGCSSLIIEPERSATGGPLFGRNLDFFTLNILDKYGIVMVIQSPGRRSFVSVSLPGVLGVLSGMNDAGLCIATLDSYYAADKSKGFEPKGVPLAFLYRQIMEECATVDEVEEFLKTKQSTTWMNLAVCDKKTGAVFEMTPKQSIRRNSEDSLLPCTNHFRCQELAGDTRCKRYEALLGASSLEKVDVVHLQEYLHAASQGKMTFQAMIFEPREMVMHLAMGSPPSSALPLTRIDVAELLAPERELAEATGGR